MAKIYKTNGKVVDVEPKNGTDFSLKELQKIVGGLIEIIYLADGENIMIVNEEGKILDLPCNDRATELLDGTFYGYVVGDVLVCSSSMVR